jgi:hypothetical protein
LLPKPAAVQEHRGQRRDHRAFVVARRGKDASETAWADPDLAVGNHGQLLVVYQLDRDRGVLVEKRLLLAGVRQAVRTSHRDRRSWGKQEDHEIHRDQRVGDPWGALHRVDVTDRNDHLTSLPVPIASVVDTAKSFWL